MNRGDRREAIFLDDADRVRFLGTLAEGCAKTDWQVHAYCLMDNHFHLESGRRNEVAAPNLYQPLQSPAQVFRAPFQRQIQGTLARRAHGLSFSAPEYARKIPGELAKGHRFMNKRLLRELPPRIVWP